MFRRTLAAALALLLFAFVYVPLALAADEPSTVLDLSPLLQTIIGLAAAALGAVGTWAISWLAKKLKLEADSQVRQALETALQNGIAYGQQKVSGMAASAHVDVKNEVVAAAAGYVLARVPDSLAHFGITPDGVRDLILARLPKQT